MMESKELKDVARDACEDSCRVEKGDYCQKPLDLRIELDDGSGVCHRMGCGQQDEYPSWPSGR